MMLHQDIDVVGIGVAVRDITVRLDPFPPPDTKVRASDFAETGGGPVPTALVTLSRLGRNCALAAPVGEDPEGRFIRQGLEAEGVDTSAVMVRAGGVSSTSVILVDGQGRRRVCEWNQAGLPLGTADVEPLLQRLDRCRYLLVDARFPEVQLEAARRCRRAGGRVALDCGHPRPGVEEILRLTDVAILSHSYPESLLGDRYDPESFVEDLRARLAPDGPRIAGLTLGPDGCLVASGDSAATRVAGIPVEAIDTTGAGDVFHGALLHALLAGDPAVEAARFANAAAACKCLGLTGRAPLPTEAEIRRLAARDLGP